LGEIFLPLNTIARNDCFTKRVDSVSYAHVVSKLKEMISGDN